MIWKIGMVNTVGAFLTRLRTSAYMASAAGDYNLEQNKLASTCVTVMLYLLVIESIMTNWSANLLNIIVN
mgnify:FL=1